MLGTSPGQTVPVPVVPRRLHLQAIPGDTHAHAHRRATVSVRHLPQTLHTEIQSQHSQADSFRYVAGRRGRRALGTVKVCGLLARTRAGPALPTNRCVVHSAGPPVPVPAVPGRLHLQAVLGDPQSHAYWRAALPVWRMPQEIRAKIYTQYTQKNAHRLVDNALSTL